MMTPCDVESVIFLYIWHYFLYPLRTILYNFYFPMDLGPGNKATKLHSWWGCDRGYSGSWASPPPVKTWLPWQQLSYRLSAQPLIPSSGTRGSRNFTISVRLHLLCAQLYFLVCDGLHIGYTLSVSLPLCICSCLFDCSHVLLSSSRHPSFSLCQTCTVCPHYSLFFLPLLKSNLALVFAVSFSVSVPLCFPISLPPSALAV